MEISTNVEKEQIYPLFPFLVFLSFYIRGVLLTVTDRRATLTFLGLISSLDALLFEKFLL